MQDDLDIAAAMFEQTKFGTTHLRTSNNPHDRYFHNLISKKNREQPCFGVHGKTIAFPRHRLKNLRAVKLEVISEVVLLDLKKCFHEPMKQTVHQKFEKRITDHSPAFDKTGTDHAVALLLVERGDHRPDLADVFDKIAVHRKHALGLRVDPSEPGLERAANPARWRSFNQKDFWASFAQVYDNCRRPVLFSIVQHHHVDDLLVVVGQLALLLSGHGLLFVGGDQNERKRLHWN